MPRPRNPNVVPRIYTILRSGETLNGQQLSNRMNISERTLMRVLDHMRKDLSLDVQFSREVGGYVLRDDAAQLPAGFLSRSEAMALSFAAQMAASYSFPFSYGLNLAARHMAEILRNQMLVDIDDLLHPVRFSPSPSREVNTAFLDQLSSATASGTTLEMTYYTASRNALGKRLFDPYLVEFRASDWYTVGYCHLRKRVRVFAVSRIHNLRQTAFRFEISADFEPRHVFRNALGAIAADSAVDVVIEFAASEARWVMERKWHPSMEAESLNGGGLRLRMQVAVTAELRKWILGYGASARVASPADLAEDIASELKRAAKNYASRKAHKH